MAHTNKHTIVILDFLSTFCYESHSIWDTFNLAYWQFFFSQMFTTGIMDALSTIQSRITGLENVFDRLSQESLQRGRHSYSENSKLGRQSENVASPRFSICTPTPRPSVEINNKQSDSMSVKNSESWEKKAFSRSQPRIHSGDSLDMWKSNKVKATRKFTEKDVLNSSSKDTLQMGSVKNDGIFSATRITNARNDCSESNNNYWKHVKRLVCEGDLNSAYREALCFSDEFILVELLNTTGPVIESLSVKTMNVLLSTLASYLLEGKLFNTIIPWLQQASSLTLIKYCTANIDYCFEKKAKPFSCCSEMHLFLILSF